MYVNHKKKKKKKKKVERQGERGNIMSKRNRTVYFHKVEFPLAISNIKCYVLYEPVGVRKEC